MAPRHWLNLLDPQTCVNSERRPAELVLIFISCTLQKLISFGHWTLGSGPITTQARPPRKFVKSRVHKHKVHYLALQPSWDGEPTTVRNLLSWRWGQGCQAPATYRPVPAAGQDPQVWHFSVQLQPGQGREREKRLKPNKQKKKKKSAQWCRHFLCTLLSDSSTTADCILK